MGRRSRLRGNSRPPSFPRWFIRVHPIPDRFGGEGVDERTYRENWRRNSIGRSAKCKILPVIRSARRDAPTPRDAGDCYLTYHVQTGEVLLRGSLSQLNQLLI